MKVANLILSMAITAIMTSTCFAEDVKAMAKDAVKSALKDAAKSAVEDVIKTKEAAKTEEVKAEETVKTEEVKGETNMTTINETIKTIHQRKSVRNYTDQAVTKEQLETLVRAGMAAPTAINTQPWQFVIVTDKALKADYAKGNMQEAMINKCSAMIVVCCDMSLENDRAKNFWQQDCAAATENILLAAESMGLGTVWTGVYPVEERVKTVSEKFGLPENVTPFCVILVGYPDGSDQPKDKYKAERVHWNKY